MRQANAAFWKATLVALVRRRERRGVGLYTVCAILVVLYALSVLYGIGAEAPPDGPRLSDFVISALWVSLPVAVALMQVWRQTLLGWFLLLAGFGVPALALCYWLINERLVEGWPLIILAILIAMCVGLVRHRPTMSG
jgi:peptidoglycan/LPS O-acetylase OafA/YrhL